MEPERREVTYSYRNLQLWQKAQELAVEVVRVVDRLPSRRSNDVVARQLVGAATSVAANIAEGHGRFTLPAYRNHLSIAKGSACEADSWINLLARLGLVDDATESALHGRCAELIAALTRRMKALAERETRTRVREETLSYDADSGAELDNEPR
jgi:four helix bundle protein